jgi:hypothetical protein
MLLTQGNYKSIFKERIEKYGTVEPAVLDKKTIAMKTENPARKQNEVKNRTRQYAK